ncbi:MAG: hypothetical protein ABIA92_00520 [Patescibacteria group bacterium]
MISFSSKGREVQDESYRIILPDDADKGLRPRLEAKLVEYERRLEYEHFDNHNQIYTQFKIELLRRLLENGEVNVDEVVRIFVSVFKEKFDVNYSKKSAHVISEYVRKGEAFGKSLPNPEYKEEEVVQKGKGGIVEKLVRCLWRKKE